MSTAVGINMATGCGKSLPSIFLLYTFGPSHSNKSHIPGIMTLVADSFKKIFCYTILASGSNSKHISAVQLITFPRSKFGILNLIKIADLSKTSFFPIIIDGSVKSWFMPQAATYEERSLLFLHNYSSVKAIQYQHVIVALTK